MTEEHVVYSGEVVELPTNDFTRARIFLRHFESHVQEIEQKKEIFMEGFESGKKFEKNQNAEARIKMILIQAYAIAVTVLWVIQLIK